MYLFIGTGDKDIPNQLQETDGTILSSSQCTSDWRNNYNHAVHICIDNQQTGTCQVSLLSKYVFYITWLGVLQSSTPSFKVVLVTPRQ